MTKETRKILTEIVDKLNVMTDKTLEVASKQKDNSRELYWEGKVGGFLQVRYYIIDEYLEKEPIIPEPTIEELTDPECYACKHDITCKGSEEPCRTCVRNFFNHRCATGFEREDSKC